VSTPVSRSKTHVSELPHPAGRMAASAVGAGAASSVQAVSADAAAAENSLIRLCFVFNLDSSVFCSILREPFLCLL
jgi:hypothetical protein